MSKIPSVYYKMSHKIILNTKSSINRFEPKKNLYLIIYLFIGKIIINSDEIIDN